MPRPKPPEPLIPYGVRLTAAQILAIKELGGSVWLRTTLTRITRQRALRTNARVLEDRNKRMRAAYKAGMSQGKIAEVFHLGRQMVGRILKEKK
jgi:hypothetical protein